MALGCVFLAAGVFLVFYFLEGEEAKIRRRFGDLSACVSKERGETHLEAGLKRRRLRGFFAPRCELVSPARFLNGIYTGDEVAAHVFMARSHFEELAVDFYDLDIRFPDEGEGARAVLTVRVSGAGGAPGAGAVKEARELECDLVKRGGEWLFSRCEAAEVLEK